MGEEDDGGKKNATKHPAKGLATRATGRSGGFEDAGGSVPVPRCLTWQSWMLRQKLECDPSS